MNRAMRFLLLFALAGALTRGSDDAPEPNGAPADCSTENEAYDYHRGLDPKACLPHRDASLIERGHHAIPRSRTHSYAEIETGPESYNQWSGQGHQGT